MKYIAYSDASSFRKYHTLAYVIFDEIGEIVAAHNEKNMGKKNIMIAEYEALLMLTTRIIELNIDNIEIKVDSMNMIHHLHGKAKFHPDIMPRYNKLRKEVLNSLQEIEIGLESISWVIGSKNPAHKLADKAKSI